MFDGVPLPEHRVVELHGAVVELYIGDRKAERFARRVGGNRPVEQIGDVEALFRRTNEMHRRPLDAKLLDHQRQPKQRDPRYLDTKMVDLDERCCHPALTNLQLVDIHLEGVGVEANGTHPHGTMQRSSHCPCYDMTQQEGRTDKTREPEQRDDSTGSSTDPTYDSVQ